MSKVIGKECRFAVYVPPPEYDKPDMHFVKLQVHYDDGTIKPETKIFYNFQRPYYVVHKGKRVYNQPKEWISKDDVIEYSSTQSQLLSNAARSLGMPYFKGTLRDLQKNPYLFGTDIKSTSILKWAYQERFKETKQTYYSYATFDTETDVLRGTNRIIMATVVMGSKIFTAVLKDFVSGIHDPLGRIRSSYNEYLKDYIEKYSLTDETIIVEDELEILKKTFAFVHENKPDFLGIWNIDFDLNKVIQTCEKYSYPVAKLLSDPSVPDEYKYFKYTPGASQKRTASGKVQPLPAHSRWSTAQCPASFYFIDAMQAYKQVRTGRPEESSYSLDSILQKELNLTKLKFDQANKYSGLAWHIYMQKNYPIEYIVYNKFDSLSMLLLEAKVKDIALSTPSSAKCSDFSDIKSQPKKAIDDLNWFTQERNLVMGTSSEAVSDEITKGINVKGWVTNLAASLISEDGHRVIEEDPRIITSIYTNVGDLDVSSSYPHGVITFNISKETTVKEVINIEDIPQATYEKDNMLLNNGHVDAIQWCTSLCQFPTLAELCDLYDKESK